MARFFARAAVAVALVALGWAVARAQAPTPNFELVVDAPAGPTSIRCVRGCTLAWVERGVNPNARPQTSFDFSCSGGGVEHCSSGKVGGWIAP